MFAGYLKLGGWVISCLIACSISCFIGCSGAHKPCMTMSGASELFSGAASIRVDVFGKGVTCDAVFADTAGAPQNSLTVAVSPQVRVDIPSGEHTLLITTFSDADGKIGLGRACATGNFSQGSDTCLDLTLEAVPDGGCDDTTQTVTDCGACGRACSADHTDVRSCGLGLCTSTCQNGWGNCTQPISPTIDNGCETDLHTVAHCGDCLTACSLAQATPKCPAGACMVDTCDSNFQDCDSTAANGCECAGTGCCAGACQLQHANCVGGSCGAAGLGQHFFDCAALGTYDQTQANEAAASFMPGDSNWNTFPGNCNGDTDTITVCKQKITGPAQCVCWGFANSTHATMTQGHVKANNGGCSCPTSGDPAWQ